MRKRILDSYARESDRGDERNVSITGQHQVNVRRIEDLGAELGELLSDKGKSAWKKGVARDDWEKLIKRLESGATDGAVLYDVERLLRRTEDALRILDMAESGFKIYDSDMEFDLTTPSGRKAFRDAASAAEYYSDRLSTKVQRGNRQKAVRGEGRRGRHRPFGFEEDGQTVRESERPYIQEAVRRMLAGAKWPEVCAYLNGEGVYSSAQVHTAECTARRDALIGIKYRQYGCQCPRRPWIDVSLRTALLATRMAGYVSLGRSQIVGRLPGEPIIDPVDWQALHALVQSRRGRPPTDTYLCSGKDNPVCCADCGGYFTVNSPDRRNYPDGTKRRHYTCSRKAGGCGKIIADWRALDRAVAAMVVDRLSEPEQLQEIQQVQDARNAALKPHLEEISRLEGLRQTWNRRLNAGKISEESHDALVDDLDDRIGKEQKKMEKIQAAPVPAVHVDTLPDIRQEWKTATPARKRERLRQAYSGYFIPVSPGSSAEDDVRYRIGAPKPVPRRLKK